MKSDKGQHYDTPLSQATAVVTPGPDPNIKPDTSDEGFFVVEILDNAIADANDKVPVPIVEADDIDDKGVPKGCRDILKSFQWPLIALFVLAIAAAYVIHRYDPFLYVYFPYFACIVNYLGGVPSTLASLDKMASAVVPRLGAMENDVRASATRTKQKAINGKERYSDYLKSQWSGSSSIEPDKKTKKFDLPDSIEKDLESYEVIEDVKKDSNDQVNSRGSKFVPLPFQSQELFHMFVTVPVLVTTFGIQLFIVWVLQLIFPAAVGEEIRNKWGPLISACQTFFVVVLQILISYMLLSAQRVAHVINVNLRKQAGGVNDFKARLAKCMEFIKSTLLALMKFIASKLKMSQFGETIVNNTKLLASKIW